MDFLRTTNGEGDDAAKIHAFAKWLASRRPLSRVARKEAFKLRAQLATLDEEARVHEATDATRICASSRSALERTCARLPNHKVAAIMKNKREPTFMPTVLRACYSAHEASDDIWIFGYGSILWRQGFAYERIIVGYVKGFVRRFHLGDTAHRGVEGAPGRAVTLEKADDEGICWGAAFLLPAESALSILDRMDVREASYEKKSLDLFGRACDSVPLVGDVVAYVVSPCAAKRREVGYLGPAPVEGIAQQILTSRGPSGRNTDYLFRLATWLRDHAIHDDHVTAIDRKVRDLQQAEDEARVCDDDGDVGNNYYNQGAPPVGVKGVVVVDRGCAEVVSNCARNLLAVGVVAVHGTFDRHASVSVETVDGASIARGTVCYSSADLDRIKGQRSSKCKDLLPEHPDEHGLVIAKTHMTLS